MRAQDNEKELALKQKAEESEQSKNESTGRKMETGAGPYEKQNADPDSKRE